MKTRCIPVAAAIALVLSHAPLAAHAQAPAAGAAPAASAASTVAPREWIRYDDIDMTPVVDDVSRALAEARGALAAHDNRRAADALHAAARALHAQAERPARQDGARPPADSKAASAVRRRLATLAGQIDDAAAAVRAGRLGSTAELDRLLGRAQRDDLDRRWLLTDVETWYPLTQEPQRHFSAALADYGRKQYTAAAGEVRQAAAYLRLEAARAQGDARKRLEEAETRLGRTAASLERGGIHDERALRASFSHADHALALAQHARAAESWGRKAYREAGYALQAAAQGLEDAGAWTDAEAGAAAKAAAADARLAGVKLANGAHWTHEEVTRGLDMLQRDLARLRHPGANGLPARGKSAPEGAQG